MRKLTTTMKKIYSLFSIIFCFVCSSDAQWTNANPNFTQATSIASISAPGSQIVWLAGRDTSQAVAGNRFARSINGGATWTNFTITGFASYTPSNISAINADTAWVAMYNSTGGGGIFRTNNGGGLWTQQTTAAFLAPNGFPNFVHFFDANNGVCMGDPNGGYFEIYTTSNGGALWSRVASTNILASLDQEYGTVNKFSTSGNLVTFVTTKGRIFVSQNKGLSWAYNPISTGADTLYAGWVQPKSATELLALCFPQTSGPAKIARSTNAGLTWQTSDWVGFVDNNAAGYAAVSSTKGLHITLARSDAHFSYDDGKNWRPLAVNLNNFGLYNEAAIGTSPDGRIWLGGRYLSGSQTGLMRYVTPSRDLAVVTTQVGGGKTNCFGKDTLEVVLLNTGSTTINFATNPVNINFMLQGRAPGNTTYTTPSALNQLVDTGMLGPGATLVQKWTGGTLNAAVSEYLISTNISLSNTVPSIGWNDTSTTIYINGPRRISLTDVSNGGAASTLYKGSKGLLKCSGSFNGIQWQSRLLNGNWVNEAGATSAQFQFTAVETKYYRALTCGGQSSDSILLTVPEAVEAVGYTYYYNQTNAAINNRIQLSGSKLSAVFTGSMDSTNTAMADRGTFYNHNNGTTWGSPVVSRIENFRTGFPSIATTKTGKEIVVVHSGSQKLSLFRSDSLGGGSWTQSIDFAKGMWPRIVAGNGDTIHVIALDTSIVLGAKLRYYRSINAGNTWDIAINLPGYDVANGFAYTAAETYAIQAKGNIVAIVAGGWNNKLTLWKSVNAGQTWTNKTIKTFPAGFAGNTTLPFTATTDGIMSIVIDNSNEANVFTGKMFIQDDVANDGQWNHFPNTDGLLYWKETWATDSLVEIATAAQTGYITGDFVPSNNAGLCSYPSASVNQSTGTLFVTFTVPVTGTTDNVTNVNRCDIFGMMSNDGGNTWSVPQNLTQSAVHGIDNSFASTANNSNGTVHALWQSSTTPIARNDGRVSRKTMVHGAFPYSSFESITLMPLSLSNVCGNDSVDVTFSSVGLFGTVSIQLSDLTFSFNNPINLGTFTNTNALVTRRVKIPNAVKAGMHLIRVVGSSGTASDEMSQITITPIANKPVITNTRPLTFCNGDSTILTVDTAQIGANNHYWVVNGVMDVTSHNKRSYAVNSTANVQVFVNPLNCTTKSDTVKTIRNTNQAISINLTSDTIVCSGSTLTLKAIVTTGRPTSYQWRKNGTATGSNSPNLVLGTVDNLSAGKYTISINSQCAVYNSDTIDVLVNVAPIIISQPQAITTCDGSNAVFRVAANSLTPVSYQWKKGTQNLGTVDSLIIFNAAITDTGEYMCTVTNSCGFVLSQGAKLSVTQALSINSVLSDTSVCKGNSLTLTINVSGSDVQYRWYKDTTVLSTNATLSISNIKLTDSGAYYVEVSNNCGLLVSNVVTVSVTDAAVVSVERVSGDTLRAKVTGSFTTLSWYVNDSLITGAADTLLVATKSGSYTARVTSGSNCQNTSTPYIHALTGLATNNSRDRIILYPNPASTIVYISGLSGQHGSIRVADLLGKQLLERELLNTTLQLDVSELPAGMYVIQIQTEKGLSVEKIQIQR